jgi:cell division protease FtsH
MPGVDLHHYFVAMRDFVVNWWPLLGLTFYMLLLYIFWRMLQLMPSVKPAEVDTKSRSAVTWTDVAGVDEVRAELQEVVDFLRNPGQFERLGARVPKGILLHGPPGTGKTLLAKAARPSPARPSSPRARRRSSRCSPASARRASAALQGRAQEGARDHLHRRARRGRHRAQRPQLNREQDQTLNQLLVELDGFGGEDQVVVMGASNRLDQLDPRCCDPAASTARCSSARPTLVAARRSCACTRATSRWPGCRPPTVARQTAGSPAPISRTSPTRRRSSPAARR